jgi:bifunctional UDP-N-acetylglucosamine pyrophosphorylase/glucosamine-1-phosphate N-acetyltransferase
VKLGDRVRIHPNCVIRDSEIGDDTQVFPNSVVENGSIGASCNIGPFARIRPGAKLSAGVHIGNFVEVKNAVMGDGSKANHLAYVGDAEVGARVNIGAGTIIANYDGVNKHRTEIGSHVRVSTNTVFVAPVRMGDGAYTGAGTVVRKDVPPGALAITVAPQRNIEGWVATKRPGTEAARAAEESGE